MFSFHWKYFVYRELKRAPQKVSFCFQCPDTGTVRIPGNIQYNQLYGIDIFLEIHLVHFSFQFDVFFLKTHRCLFNWVIHNTGIRFCEFLLGIIASYTAKDKFSINTLFLNYTIQLTRACSSITRVSWFASACVRTQSIAAHRIYVTAMRVGRTFVDV